LLAPLGRTMQFASIKAISAKRSMQVAIMANIYAEAENVFVWLGARDKFCCSDLAMSLMIELVKISDTAIVQQYYSQHNGPLPVQPQFEGFIDSPISGGRARQDHLPCPAR
jgi:hypothetical protein